MAFLILDHSKNTHIKVHFTVHWLHTPMVASPSYLRLRLWLSLSGTVRHASIFTNIVEQGTQAEQSASLGGFRLIHAKCGH